MYHSAKEWILTMTFLHYYFHLFRSNKVARRYKPCHNHPFHVTQIPYLFPKYVLHILHSVKIHRDLSFIPHSNSLKQSFFKIYKEMQGYTIFYIQLAMKKKNICNIVRMKCLNQSDTGRALPWLVCLCMCWGGSGVNYIFVSPDCFLCVCVGFLFCFVFPSPYMKRLQLVMFRRIVVQVWFWPYSWISNDV